MKQIGVVKYVGDNLTTERAGSVVALQEGDAVVEGDVLRSSGDSKVYIQGNGKQLPTIMTMQAGGIASLSYDAAADRVVVAKNPKCTSVVDGYTDAESSAVFVDDQSLVVAEPVQEDESNILSALLFGGALFGGAALLASDDKDSQSAVSMDRPISNNPVDNVLDDVVGGIGGGVGGDNDSNGNGQGNNGIGLGNGGGNGTGNEGNGQGNGIIVPVLDKVGDGLEKTPLKDITKPLIGDASDDIGIIGIIKGIGSACDNDLEPTPLKPVGNLLSDIFGKNPKNDSDDIDGLIGLVDKISDSVDDALEPTPLEPIGNLVNSIVGSKETGDKEGFVCDLLLTVDNTLVSIGSKTALEPVTNLVDNILTGR